MAREDDMQPIYDKSPSYVSPGTDSGKNLHCHTLKFIVSTIVTIVNRQST